MKTTYTLVIKPDENNRERDLSVAGDAMQIMAFAEKYLTETEEMCKALAHMQLGLTDSFVSQPTFSKDSAFVIEVAHDSRAYDIISALQGLSETPKTTLKTCALRVAAIAASNASTDQTKTQALLIHNFFLLI